MDLHAGNKQHLHRLVAEASLAGLEFRIPLSLNDARLGEARGVESTGDSPRPGDQQPHVRKQKRPQARAHVKRISHEAGDLSVGCVLLQTRFQLAVMPGPGVAVVFWAADQFHATETLSVREVLRNRVVVWGDLASSIWRPRRNLIEPAITSPGIGLIRRPISPGLI